VETQAEQHHGSLWAATNLQLPQLFVSPYGWLFLLTKPMFIFISSCACTSCACRLLMGEHGRGMWTKALDVLAHMCPSYSFQLFVFVLLYK
jgi:hypothetical protein